MMKNRQSKLEILNYKLNDDDESEERKAVIQAKLKKFLGEFSNKKVFGRL